MSMTQVQHAGEKVGAIARPLDTPESVPDPGETSLEGLEQTLPDAEGDLNAGIREGEEGSYGAGIAGPEVDFAVPTLSELGLKEATTPHKGGETVILSRLGKILKDDEEFCATFEKPKTSPAAFEPQATFLTSPYLHFGALSVRYFYHAVNDIVETRRKEKKSVSEPPTSLTGQLLFRICISRRRVRLAGSLDRRMGMGMCASCRGIYRVKLM